jgi:hypothetical protein
MYMLNIFSTKNLICLFAFFVIVSCSKKNSGEPEVAASVISNLVYSPNSLSLQSGVAGSSVKPSLSGTLPVSFSISSSPTNSGITIDSEGKVKVASTVAAGTYNISVTATNAAGTVKFDNAYSITVSASAIPQNLSYSPNSITISQGTTVASAAPSVTSSTSVSYSISVSPASPAISINNQGVISAASTLATGIYSVTVTATNSSGSKAFANAYTITVNSNSTASVTYTNTIQAIIQNNCGTCHINGPQVKFDSYASTKNNIDAILSRIKLAQGAAGMMPNGGTRLPQETINSVQKWKDDGLLE